MFQEYLNSFRELITEGNKNNGICFDGVVDKERYFSREKRLMLLLKETNGNDNNGDRNDVLTDWVYMDWVHNQALGKEPLYRSVYRNIAMWSRMFNTYTDENRNPEIREFINNDGLIIDEKLLNSLLDIAIINLKKSWGTEATDWNEMNKYLDDKQRCAILKYQINKLNPTLVLCGGTFDFAKKIYDGEVEELSKEGVRYFIKDSLVFVSCYHPSRPGWSRQKSFDHINSIFKLFLF